MKALNIGGLKVRVPIIQGGMGIAVSLSGLASAVANEGGIGVISAVGIGMTEPDYKKHFKQANKTALRKEIRKARAQTDGVLGVNIMMAISDFDELLKIAVDEEIDVAFIGAGLFLKNPADMERSHTKFVPKVSSARAANLIFKYWSEKYNRVPDAVVVEGPLAGGHLGFKKAKINSQKNTLDILVRETVDILRQYEQKYGREIPVIAGGGIYSGADMKRITDAGAKAVKIGTRFVTTHECDVSDAFKQNYIKAKKGDVTIIDSPVGLPGRVISNEFTEAINRGERKPVNCSWRCLKSCNYKEVPFCIADALFNAAQGNFEKGFSFAGSNAYKAKKIISVKETMAQIKREYYREQAIERKLVAKESSAYAL